jgi:hypothetical protein
VVGRCHVARGVADEHGGRFVERDVVLRGGAPPRDLDEAGANWVVGAVGADLEVQVGV